PAGRLRRGRAAEAGAPARVPRADPAARRRTDRGVPLHPGAARRSRRVVAVGTLRARPAGGSTETSSPDPAPPPRKDRPPPPRGGEGRAGRHDVLSMLVDALDEAGEPMSDAELLDEMFTLLMAGHETTATSLSWTFFHVLPRPDVVDRLRGELRAVAGDDGRV